VSPADLSPGSTGGRLLVALVVTGGLVASFAVAQGTGNRALGAVVLIAAGVWCAVRLWRTVGWLRTIVVGATYAVAFAVSHPLGNVIGSWPSVLVVSAVAGTVAWLLGSPQSRPTGSLVSTTSPPTSSTR
jgi:hypothetical protein